MYRALSKNILFVLLILILAFPVCAKDVAPEVEAARKQKVEERLKAERQKEEDQMRKDYEDRAKQKRENFIKLYGNPDTKVTK